MVGGTKFHRVILESGPGSHEQRQRQHQEQHQNLPRKEKSKPFTSPRVSWQRRHGYRGCPILPRTSRKGGIPTTAASLGISSMVLSCRRPFV